MQRRTFISLVSGAVATLPLAARGQMPGKAPKRIAFFPDLVPSSLEIWRKEMRAFGWTEGQDFVLVQSGIVAGGRSPLSEAARQVVADSPDVICTLSTAFTLAAQRASASIPIVMLTSGYPVEAGVADSLARPGRNVTGNSMYAAMGVWGKLLQLLRESKPGLKRVGVLWTYTMPAFPKEEIEPGYAELNAAARLLNLDLHIVEVTSSNQVQAALDEVGQRDPDGLLLTSLFPAAMSIVTRYAVDKGLPTIADFNWTNLPPPHPLLCYGPIYRELLHSAVATVDKILRGSSPGDLPIQRPSRFELIVSLKTAAAIRLDVPHTLVAQADQVIE